MFEHYWWCLALGYEVFVRCYSYIDVVLLHCLDVVLKYSVVFCSSGSGIGKKIMAMGMPKLFPLCLGAGSSLTSFNGTSIVIWL